jgi:hypothetical protein
MMVDITDYFMKNMHHFFKEAIATKHKKEQYKEALETVLTGKVWQLVKTTIFIKKCDIDIFLKWA